MKSLRDRPDAAASIRIVHSIPGRLRLRVPPHIDARLVRESVQDVEGIVSCVFSPTTRGILVRYGPEVSLDAILEAAGEAAGDSTVAESRPDGTDVAVAESRADGGDGALVELGANPGNASGPVLGAAVSGVAGEIDRVVRQVTGNLVGLGGLVPAALAVWAVRELMLGRTAPLAWSSALWYAHGLFRDYNTPASH